MDYFLIKQSGAISIPKPQKPEPLQDPSVRIMEGILSLDKFDYIAAEHLISDPLKLLLEQYLPQQPWRPCVFVEPSKKAQKAFWFLPPLPYLPDRIVFASNGLPAAVYISEQDFARKSPGIFRIRNPKGTVFIVIHLSIAESILRRGICGFELVRLQGTIGK